ncbi:MAG: protein phosphatase 2C domain-containing protein [Anaerolineae bacterium]|nr:protein phosphatase 2C domain-containing protein [Anaerolineae bacterium]
MSTVDDLRLPQTYETAALVIAGEIFHLQVAYARSADSRASDDLGQDYLSVRQDGDRLAFVLCDGVSQSFVGDLAARVLGEAMLEWLWQLDAETAQAQVLQETCHQYLQELSSTVAPQVTNYSLPGDLPPMLREVLERKRELGSESTLSAGLLDVAADKLLLVWLGDSRIRLWDRQGECTAVLGDTFLTQERWSTHRGPIGRVHVFITNLKDIKRVVAYSDGLAVMDRGLNDSLTMRSLDAVITEAGDAPTSDDISFLEVRFSPFVEAEGEPRLLVTMAEAIRLTSSKPHPLEVEAPALEVPAAVESPKTVMVSPPSPETRVSAVSAAPLPPPKPASPPPEPVSTFVSAPTLEPQPSPSQVKPPGRFDRISQIGIGAIGVVTLLCLVLAGVFVLGLLPGRKAQETPVPTSTLEPTVAATPIVVTYVVTPKVVGEGGGIQPSDPQTIKEGESVTFKFLPEEGYVVAEVLINGKPVGRPDQYTIPNISMPQKVVVRFAPKTYIIRLTVEDGAGGTIVREGADGDVRSFFRVKHDQSVRLLIRPDEGYKLDWLRVNDVDGTSLKSVDGQQESWLYEISNVREPYSVRVKFELEEYTIEATAVPEAGGIISPTGTVTVTHGFTRTFEIKPNEGYQIAAVLVDGDTVRKENKYTFPPVVANHTIQAQFELKTYTVQVVVEGLPEGVTASVEPGFSQSVQHGQRVSFKITPPNDYRFKQVLFNEQELQQWQTLLQSQQPDTQLSFEFEPIDNDSIIRVVFESTSQ